MNKNIFYWPIVCGPVVCKNKSLCDESETVEPVVPETLGESAGLNQTDIKGLCLTAVYVLIAEGTLTIADVHGAYARAYGGAISSSQTRNS